MSIVSLEQRIFVILLLFLVGCRPEFQTRSIGDIPLEISQPGSDTINIDSVMHNATKRVKESLPNAYLGGLVFTGKCQDLPQPRGKIILIFTQTDRYLLEQQVLSAVATVDTTNQTMTLFVTDETDYYPSTDPAPIITNHQFQKMTNVAYQQISELGLTDCDVTITQLNEAWDVRCGPIENFVAECSFSIDYETNKVGERVSPK